MANHASTNIILAGEDKELLHKAKHLIIAYLGEEHSEDVKTHKYGQSKTLLLTSIMGNCKHYLSDNYLEKIEKALEQIEFKNENDLFISVLSSEGGSHSYRSANSFITELFLEEEQQKLGLVFDEIETFETFEEMVESTTTFLSSEIQDEIKYLNLDEEQEE